MHPILLFCTTPLILSVAVSMISIAATTNGFDFRLVTIKMLIADAIDQPINWGA